MVQVGEQARIVDQNVDGAELSHRVRHQVLDRFLRGDVGAHVDGALLRFGDALGNRVAIEHVGNDHFGAGGRQAFAEGGADAARAAGHDRNLVLEPRVHVFLP